MYISVLEYVICHYEVEVIHLFVHIAIEHVIDIVIIQMVLLTMLLSYLHMYLYLHVSVFFTNDTILFTNYELCGCLATRLLLLKIAHMKWSCINQLSRHCNFPSLFLLHLPLILWMAVALIIKHIVSAYQGRQRWHCISHSFYKRMHTKNYTSGVRQSASVVKVSVRIHNGRFKRTLMYLILLKVEQSAFIQVSFSSLFGIHKCSFSSLSGIHKYSGGL